MTPETYETKLVQAYEDLRRLSAAYAAINRVTMGETYELRHARGVLAKCIVNLSQTVSRYEHAIALARPAGDEEATQ